MKTTIDIDESKLLALMRLTGIKTRKEAVDFALTEAGRKVRVHQILATPLYVGPDDEPVIHPQYDLMKLRELEKPSHGGTDPG